MKTINLLVFFLAIVSLVLVANVSAATGNLATITKVEVNGIADGAGDVSVTAGEYAYITVYFTSVVNASDVKVKAEIEGIKVDVTEETSSFPVEDGLRSSKTLKLAIPSELKDEVSDDLALNIKIWNGDYKTEYPEVTLRVMRPSYNVDVMSIETTSTITAGDTLAVEVVLKNTGYNNLDDLYLTASIPALGIQKKSYLGDILSLDCTGDDCNDDDKDTVRGVFYLNIPYDAKAGIYALSVEAENDDLIGSREKQIVIENDLPNSVIASNANNKVSVGENAQYSLLLVNPTNKLKIFNVAIEATGLTASVDNSVVAVPAGSTKTVTVTASADKEGEYNFNVNVLSGGAIVETVGLNLYVEGSSVTNPVVVLTIVLAIIFLVLLVVLIVLLGKKSEKSEDFGESYY